MGGLFVLTLGFCCRASLRQLAFMAARQLFTLEVPASVGIRDDLNAIMANTHLSAYFQSFAREVIIAHTH